MVTAIGGRPSASRGRTAFLLVGFLLACSVVGCERPQPLSPEGDHSSPALLVLASDPAGTAAAAYPGGIPIGLFAQPLSEYGARYDGGHRNTPPSSLLADLETIRSQGGKVVLMFAGSQTNYKDADGHFSLSLWEGRVDRYRGVDFSSYVDDGTIIAHYLLDEPNDPSNWNGQVVSGATVEQMAAYSKQIWPTLPTVVRVEPGYLAQANVNYRYLDAAWAQYVYRKGEIHTYAAQNVADAQALGLQLIFGLNLLTGSPDKLALSAQQVVDWGSALLDSPYPCAFISYQYNATYLAGAGIGDAMDALRALAQNRSFKACGRAAPTPPPDPPAATTTTITAASPNPSTAGQAVTVAVTVTADGSTPTGTVSVTADGGTESCDITLSAGAGDCALVLTATGSRTIRATYNGGTSYATSSDSRTQDVRAAQQSVTISWSVPADITYGTALGPAQLNASASSGGQAVAGTFSYSPAAGTVLNAGTGQTLRADFTPSDPDQYASGTATVSLNVLPRAPTLTWSVPTSIQVGALASSVLSATATGLAGASVAGTYTYTPAAGQVLDAKAAQTLSVSFKPSDANYTSATKSVTVAVLYPWSGFFDPVDNSGTLNTAKAGVGIPVRFSLGGNQPAPVLASGYPQVQSVTCPSWPTDAIEQTASASGSSLKYDSATGQYVYTWKTNKGWANSCRRLTFVLKDGTRQEATFRFTK
jgi:Bacterial Ig-like domain (group 3)